MHVLWIGGERVPVLWQLQYFQVTLVLEQGCGNIRIDPYLLLLEHEHWLQLIIMPQLSIALLMKLKTIILIIFWSVVHIQLLFYDRRTLIQWMLNTAFFYFESRSCLNLRDLFDSLGRLCVLVAWIDPFIWRQHGREWRLLHSWLNTSLGKHDWIAFWLDGRPDNKIRRLPLHLSSTNTLHFNEMFL